MISGEVKMLARKWPNGKVTDIAQRELQTYADGSVDVEVNSFPPQELFGKPVSIDGNGNWIDASPTTEEVVASEKSAANEFMTSDDPKARAIRAMARIMVGSVSQVMVSFNGLLTILLQNGVITQGQFNSLKQTPRPWGALLDATKQANINETDPNT